MTAKEPLYTNEIFRKSISILVRKFWPIYIIPIFISIITTAIGLSTISLEYLIVRGTGFVFLPIFIHKMANIISIYS